MAPADAGAISAVERRSQAAIHELGERIGKIEGGQSIVIGRLESISTQLGSVCADMKRDTARLEDHETRIRLREVAYAERILPALERLHNLELKVAGSAVIGGAVVAGLAELLKALVH